MKKTQRVKSKMLFNEIIRTGKKYSNKYFTIFCEEKNEINPLFGISAPKKVGNAVIRNKLKRQTREIVHKNEKIFKKYRNYIIIVKELCLRDGFHIMNQELVNLIGEINAKEK